MNSDSLRNTEHIVLKCLALSLFLHIIFIYSFVFVFPLINESHKPKMIFLGPILKSHDTEHPSMFKTQPALPNSSSKKLTQHIGTSSTPYGRREEQKPQQRGKIKNHKKITMKSIFDTSYKSKNNGQNENFAENLQKRFKQEQYNPLSLPE